MSQPIDLYSAYAHFNEQVLDQIRKETFGIDIGQNSWITVDEYDRFVSWLDIQSGQQLLEVASGSGGPALYLAEHFGFQVTGIDASAAGVDTATKAAEESGHSDKVRFIIADANAPLRFDDNSFDGLLCIDSMNHFQNRLLVLKEWLRILRPGRRAVFTDPVVITGPVTNDELALRSAVGLFLFVPNGLNEQFIAQAGFRLLRREDASENAALIARQWYQARQNHKNELLRIEGDERFEGLQRFFETVHKLTSEKRLARIVYVVEKPGHGSVLHLL